MDLLSLIADATKRREDYFSRASRSAERAKSLKTLESLSKRDSSLLVGSFANGEIRSEELYRSLVDKTLVNSLAAVFLGAWESKPAEKMQRSWPTIIGQIIPPLVEFIKDIEESLREGSLTVQDVQGEENPEYSRKMSWLGLSARVLRYISNPAYSFFSLGEYYVKQEQGYREMRRAPVADDRTCPDCVSYGNMGWQPIGSLPMPGQRCRCYDRCRCKIEYR